MTNYFIGVASFTIGDRFQSKWDKSAICTLIKIRNSGKKPYTIEWDNKRKIHCDESWFDEMIFLEDEQCNNLISAQELVQDSVSLGCNADLTSLEPQRLTNTAQVSLNSDIQEFTTMETRKALPIMLEFTAYEEEQSISLQLPHPAPHSPQKAIAEEPTMSETVSPQSLESLTSTNQNSPQSKMSQVCSPAPIAQEMSAVTSGMFYSSFPPAGMMRTGLLSEADTVLLPSLEKDYCWLPSPGALSFSGKGRPPGQTKQEGGLKDLGLLQKGEVLNPDILCEWYGLPPNWLDPLECRAATELLENNERQQEICLIPELQRSPLTESSISIPCVENQSPIDRFLEETKPVAVSQKTKQPKGCLYKYLESKRLKDGTTVNYPRIDGERDPENPLHWRWGFNWELKINGKWKGRSIGSIPVEIILDIKLMQIDGASLEQIISFIKLSKTKKYNV
jgi:hypothetical protein